MHKTGSDRTGEGLIVLCSLLVDGWYPDRWSEPLDSVFWCVTLSQNIYLCTHFRSDTCPTRRISGRRYVLESGWSFCKVLWTCRVRVMVRRVDQGYFVIVETVGVEVGTSQSEVLPEYTVRSGDNYKNHCLSYPSVLKGVCTQKLQSILCDAMVL